jgi:uncharacterized membrane protein YhhN
MNLASSLKGLGYLISIISVGLLGIVAWPQPGEPLWKAVVVPAGMATSVIGMFLRWLSHRRDKREEGKA